MALDRICTVKWSVGGFVDTEHGPVGEANFGNRGAEHSTEHVANISYDSAQVSDSEALEKLCEEVSIPDDGTTLDVSFNYEYFG